MILHVTLLIFKKYRTKPNLDSKKQTFWKPSIFCSTLLHVKIMWTYLGWFSICQPPSNFPWLLLMTELDFRAGSRFQRMKLETRDSRHHSIKEIIETSLSRFSTFNFILVGPFLLNLPYWILTKGHILRSSLCKSNLTNGFKNKIKIVESYKNSFTTV